MNCNQWQKLWDLLTKLASHFLMCSQHSDKRLKLASWFSMCSQRCEEKTNTCIRVFDVFRTLWKKYLVYFTVLQVFTTSSKKRLKLASRFLMCSQHCKEMNETCIIVFDVFTTLWKKRLKLASCFLKGFLKFPYFVTDYLKCF